VARCRDFERSSHIKRYQRIKILITAAPQFWNPLTAEGVHVYYRISVCEMEIPGTQQIPSVAGRRKIVQPRKFQKRGIQSDQVY